MILSLMALAAATTTGGCTKPRTVTADAIAKATGARPKPGDRFLVKRVEDPEGGSPALLVYVRQGQRWLQYDALEDDQTIVGSKRAAGGREIVWGQHIAGGPFDSFEMVYFDPRRSLVCADVDFASVTNWDETRHERNYVTETLDLDDFNIDAKGRGTLIASGEIDLAGKTTPVVYRFVSRDGGRTWSKPVRIKRKYRIPGEFK